MTRDEFINKFIDEFAGQVLDAMIDRQGAERSVWTRMAFMKIKTRLGVCYDALCPSPPINGAAKAAPATQKG